MGSKHTTGLSQAMAFLSHAWRFCSSTHPPLQHPLDSSIINCPQTKPTAANSIATTAPPQSGPGGFGDIRTPSAQPGPGSTPSAFPLWPHMATAGYKNGVTSGVHSECCLLIPIQPSLQLLVGSTWLSRQHQAGSHPTSGPTAAATPPCTLRWG